MDQQAGGFYELRFKTHFLESKAAAFQDMFVAVMSKAHPGDFMPCRPWGGVGDRKNDGYLKSERTLFQVYAPAELKVAETIKKIVTDFTGALPYWRDYFDTWVFVHNAQAGLAPDVIAKLLELGKLHPSLKITHWGYEELLLRFRRLPLEALQSLYGHPPPSTENKKESEARRKLKLAQEILRRGKHTDAIREITEALAIARAEKNEEDEAEILVALSILSADRRGRGDGQHYFEQAEKKADKLKSSAARAIYYRARASALEQRGDFAGAEEAYKVALRTCAEPEDEKGNLAIQGCIVRSSFVHFLCNEKRIEEARPILAECEEYACQHKETEDGELLQAALGAGIHFSLETGDEDGAIERINELEQSATTCQLADRIGGELANIANKLSHRDAHRAALAAAEAAVRLGRHANELSPNFLVGALYTEAMVIAKARNDDATALAKAEALLDLCNDPDDGPIKYAAQHLVAELRRVSGDSQTAVDLAKKAFSVAKGRPEDIAFAKCALARALNDNGQTDEALKHVKEAWVLASPAEIPPEGAVEILSQITNYASQLGVDGAVADAMAKLDEIPDKSEKVTNAKKRAIARAEANRQLRDRLLDVLRESDPAQKAATGDCASLPEANAIVARALLRFWDDLAEAGIDCTAGAYDFWGRGNFGRMLLNARRFPNSFNITLEVRTLDDVKRALRLWGLYVDFLILLWKGPTENGLAIIPFPEDYEEPGGWGYMIAAADKIQAKGSKTWCPAMGQISIFPDDVAAFLATEARPFIQAGRLVVVPAVGAGCINPGHGPFEQLLAESANAIPSIRWKGVEGTPIGYVPHSPNAPFALLADLAEAESERLRKLRLLLLKRSRQLRPDGEIGLEAKMLSLEIDDAMRDLESRKNALTRKRGLAEAREPLTGATARFKSGGRKLSDVEDESPFAPLLILQNLGYGWRVEGPQVPNFPQRFEPQENDVIGTWLAPPSSGWIIPTAVRVNDLPA